MTEHLLKDADDLKAWLELPLPELNGEVQTEKILEFEKRLGSPIRLGRKFGLGRTVHHLPKKRRLDWRKSQSYFRIKRHNDEN
ncbi:MAG: hypothetical protein PHV82_14420 [Victivallaceae bacterium]|nr:hypothetical protein [Victivallaceae bacterium]